MMTLARPRSEKNPTNCLLGPAAWEKAVPSASMLFREGEQPASLYQIKSGCVKLIRYSSCGKESIAELLLPGDIFDLPSCWDGRPYPFSAQAATHGDLQLWMVPSAQLMEDEELLNRCQIKLLQQLRQRRCHQIFCPGERVEIRVARAILWLAHRLSQNPEHLSFPLCLTRQELADWVGTTTETVIRVLSQMRRRGLVEERNGWMTLLGTNDLQEMAAA